MAAASRLLNGLLRSRRLNSSSFAAILRPLSPYPTHETLAASFLPPPSVRSFATGSGGGGDDFRSDALGLPNVLLNDAYVGISCGDAFPPVKLAASMLDSCPNLTGLPWKLGGSERKPMARSVNELKREARAAKKLKQTAQEIVLKPPDNGLLVKELVPLARRVYAARASLFACVSRVAESIHIYSCRLCGEVHIGHPPHQIRSCDVRGSLPSKGHTWQRVGTEHVLPVVESFHLYDRVGRAVSHEEQLLVDRIPAVVELCVQAGVDIPEYPTRRRTFPVYNVSGRVIDFERRFPNDDSPGQDINAYGFWDRRKKFSASESSDLQFKNLRAAAEQGLKEWENMCTGAAKLMEKYTVQTCGYCSEVQVGPKGHRVRNCVACNHQMRDGQHAWQDARAEDILPPVYVWHVRGGNGVGKLEDGLKWYYGKLPAVVELLSQAGARVGEKYAALMREDVVVPDMEEVNFVV